MNIWHLVYFPAMDRERSIFPSLVASSSSQCNVRKSDINHLQAWLINISHAKFCPIHFSSDIIFDGDIKDGDNPREKENRFLNNFMGRLPSP